MHRALAVSSLWCGHFVVDFAAQQQIPEAGRLALASCNMSAGKTCNILQLNDLMIPNQSLPWARHEDRANTRMGTLWYPLVR